MGYNNESRKPVHHPSYDLDGAKSERRITTLMGDKVEPRRRWIEENVDFGQLEEHNILDNEYLHIEEDFE